jgi:small-conductance mechanosensitive channel
MSVSPFVRNLGILAIVALLIVVLNQETALATAGVLLRVAFFIVIGVVAYFFWRDFGRREISTWPSRAAGVLYAAVGLLVLDVGWYVVVGVAGRDALVCLVVAAICVYVGIRTWREQRLL